MSGPLDWFLHESVTARAVHRHSFAFACLVVAIVAGLAVLA